MTGWTGATPAKWVDKTEKKMDLAVRKVTQGMFKRVIMRSPVDTGRFRGNWQTAIGSVPSGTLDLDDKIGKATVAKSEAVTMGVKAGDTITLVNNLPYGPRLENGWSGQAPNGMVSLTAQKFQQVVRQIGLELVVL
jgi:hypothetical protein